MMRISETESQGGILWNRTVDGESSFLEEPYVIGDGSFRYIAYSYDVKDQVAVAPSDAQSVTKYFTTRKTT
jgi:hypothetical protein